MTTEPKKNQLYEGIIILLILIIGGLSVWFFTSNEHNEDVRQKSILLQERMQVELDSLQIQHNTLKLKYDSVVTELDLLRNPTVAPRNR